MRKIKLLSSVFAAIILLNACGNAKKSDPNYIKVGIAAGLEQDIAEAAKKEAQKNDIFALVKNEAAFVEEDPADEESDFDPEM